MENKSGDKRILTKNNQPLKTITYQDIYTLKESLEQFQSWVDGLNLIKAFFANENEPVNKKKIIREFYAVSEIFDTFHASFLCNLNVLEKRVERLSEKEKVKNHFN